MAVENRIVKVQKRNRALLRFDTARIVRAVLRAAQSVGGFRQDFLPGINSALFDAWPADEQMAEFVGDTVVVLLNANPRHLIANFPPTIEQIQEAVLHALRSHGFQHTADAYACYRWGRHWLREGALSSEQFIGNGVPATEVERQVIWNSKRGCENIEGMNQLVRAGRLGPVIAEALELYERSIDDAATKLFKRLESNNPLKMIWITGPTCSGKTTTTVKLTERLQKHGLRFVMLNLDDYFWSLVEHPTDWINDRNYETPEALDIQLLNQHLRDLLAGRTITKPVFDFKEGRRVEGAELKLEPGEILLLDCLHGLYPPMTESIEPSAQFRLYIDAQPGMYYGKPGSSRLVCSSDMRLMRRMLRDARHRNHSPLRTILHWHYVRSGELYSILPLRGLADHVINTGFGFELPVLKACFALETGCLPRPQDFAPYAGFLDAKVRYSRICELLEAVEPVSAQSLSNYDLVPGDAVVREFIGGGTVRIPHNN
ncbi:MAG TPA: ATP cone domain-containing protein [Verrucomicrobiae bacterium]|nr:ATP cone domain-containing protein [Verrucomicrobiae bacterium]